MRRQRRSRLCSAAVLPSWVVGSVLVAAPFAGVSTHPVPAADGVGQPIDWSIASSTIAPLFLAWVLLIGVAIAAMGAVLLRRDRRRARAHARL
jgi:cell division protein FtsX